MPEYSEELLTAYRETYKLDAEAFVHGKGSHKRNGSGSMSGCGNISVNLRNTVRNSRHAEKRGTAPSKKQTHQPHSCGYRVRGNGQLLPAYNRVTERELIFCGIYVCKDQKTGK